MSADSERRSAPDEPDAATEEARARLDQMRGQAGGALSGREIAKRYKLLEGDEGAPPLDWRLTPRNVLLQILAVVAFCAALWLMGSLMFTGFAILLGF